MSFHWYGRDKRGVSKWGGGWNNIPRWFSRTFLVYGIIAGVAAVGTGLYILAQPTTPPGLPVVCLVGSIHFLAFGLSGYCMERLRKRVDGLTPVKDVCTRLGIDSTTLAQVVEAKNILPVYNINGQDYYDLTQLSDAEILLRAASEPTILQQETLLRPAAASLETTPELLLHAANPPSLPAETHFSVPYVAEEPQIQSLTNKP